MALGSAQSDKVGHRLRKLGTSHHGFDSIFPDQNTSARGTNLNTARPVAKERGAPVQTRPQV